MHFWIDKRSQQCGFGRSRVAASLSGAGSSGLSFGHPPRRISSTSGSKLSNRNALPDCHHSNAAGSGSSSSSRSHQYQHQHQHQQHQHQHPQQLQQHQIQQLQQQQHQQQQQACNNNNFNIAHNYQQPGQISSTSNYTSNSNTANAATATATATTNGATIPTATTVTLNNNPHQHAYQQAHLNAANVGTQNHQNAPGNIHVVNNNATNSATFTALPTATTPHNLNQRGAAALLQNTSVGTSNVSLDQQHANQCYDMRNYHHPQFGNMSVRHYQQHPGRHCNGPTHASANSTVHGSYRCGNTRAAAAPVNTMQQQQHMNQMPYRHQHGYSHSSTETGQSNESIMGGSAPICTNTTNTTSYAVANTAHRYSSAAINMRTSNMTVDTGGGGGDAQLLPSHLKCGMCASLVLASVFVAGAKFYLDHQGTGLEVLIFCAFSATFFLAACTVSLCRVPKGLLPSGRNVVLGAQHHSDADSVMHCARAPYGRRDIASGDGGVGGGGGGGGELVNSDDIHGAPLCGQLQLIEDSANAGPPPYHIAIYFPESESSSKSKEATFEDESPPPSYDKILI